MHLYRLAAVALLAAFTLTAARAASPDKDAIAPNENLVADGIPPIPRSIVEAADRYTEFRSATLFDWHPAERQMLIGTRFADTLQVHRVKFPGGARTQLTFFKDGVDGATYPRKGGAYFAFNKDVSGSEFGQNFRFDADTGAVTLLTDGKSRNSLGEWSSAGNRLAYTSTRRNGRDTDVYVIDPSDKATDRLLAQVEGGGWQPLDWSPDDGHILLEEYVSINESYLWLLDTETGGKKPITPRPSEGAEKVAYNGGQFSADGRGVYTTTDKDSEFLRLAYLDLATGAPTFLTADTNWNVESFELSPDGKTIAYVTNEDGVGTLHLLDTATRKELPRPQVPVGVILSLKWHENSRDLGFGVSAANSPADVYSLDVTSGKMDRWTESEAGGLNPATFAKPELVRWKSFDGRPISGFLYLPPKDKFPGKRPVVISIHGGPESQTRPGFMGRQNYLLNELGVAVLMPNVRGSAGYGKTFLKLDNAEKRLDSVKDIGALLDWIKERPELDSDRIMVTGGSYGGYMTLACAVEYNDRIRCALDVVGISNFVSFLQRTEAYRRDLRRAEYGDERDPKMRDFLERTAPLNNAQKITKPLFIVQGKNDPRVPVTEAEQMVATLKKQGTLVWYLVATDEGHGFAKKRNADFQFYATVLFIREHLLK